MGYTTVADVELELRETFDGTTTPTSTEVQTMVDAVDEEVDELTGTTFNGTKSESDIFDLFVETDRFMPRKLPLESVTSISVNTGDEYTPTWESISKHYVDGNWIYTDRAYVGMRKIKLDYTYGYSTVPYNVKRLATLLVVKKIAFGNAVSSNAFSEVSIGPIKAKRNIGTSRLVNLDSEISYYKRKVGNFKKIAR
jgi:hypothetical protein